MKKNMAVGMVLGLAMLNGTAFAAVERGHTACTLWMMGRHLNQVNYSCDGQTSQDLTVEINLQIRPAGERIGADERSSAAISKFIHAGYRPMSCVLNTPSSDPRLICFFIGGDT